MEGIDIAKAWADQAPWALAMMGLDEQSKAGTASTANRTRLPRRNRPSLPLQTVTSLDTGNTAL